MTTLCSRVLVCLAIVVVGTAGSAHANTSRRTSHPRTPLGHFSVGEQSFDGTISGLRSYLESVRGTEPDLYAKLIPDVDRMDTRMRTAGLLVGVGLAGGLGTIAYGLATRSDCVTPSVADPNYAAKAAEWRSCYGRGMQQMAIFTSIGAGVLVTGWLSAMVIAPDRGDYVNFMNRHNTLSPRAMRFQLGYDPNRRFAHAGAVFSF